MDDERNAEPRLVGGHPALDLINTVAPRRTGEHDHREYLGGAADLLAWAQRARVIDLAEAAAVTQAWAAAPVTAVQALRAAVDVREAAYAVLAARLDGVAPDAGPALERLSLRWAAAAARSELVLHAGEGAAARLVVGTTPASLIPDRLAHTAVELLRTVDLRHLRVCPITEGGCGWLFLDRSRNGSRRWCAMADCGSQAKARRLTEKRRAHRATTDYPISR